MNTFYQIWGVTTPIDALAKIEFQRQESGVIEPKNLEEQAISLVGKDIYEKLIKGYTEKQWGRPATELPALSSNDCQYASLLIIIILMTGIREYRLGDILQSLREC